MIRSVSVDGSHPEMETLIRRATVNYGHFTSMQVRNHAVKGFDLHMARLRAASTELHDADLDTQRVHAYLKAGLMGSGDASVRIDVWPAAAPGPAEHIMVTVSDPEPAPAGPLALKSVSYQRPVPQIKHAGSFAQLFHLKQAQKAGFDDALLLGHRGEIAETAIANIGFIQGGMIVWPEAEALCGVTWQLLDQISTSQGLTASLRPLRLHELSSFDAAFTANSRGITGVGRIDDMEFPVKNEMLEKLTEWYGSNPAQLI